MKHRSNSSFLKQQHVKDAVAQNSHVAALAAKFDKAHLNVQKNASLKNKRLKAIAKQSLNEAIALLSKAA